MGWLSEEAPLDLEWRRCERLLKPRPTPHSTCAAGEVPAALNVICVVQSQR